MCQCLLSLPAKNKSCPIYLHLFDYKKVLTIARVEKKGEKETEQNPSRRPNIPRVYTSKDKEYLLKK